MPNNQSCSFTTQAGYADAFNKQRLPLVAAKYGLKHRGAVAASLIYTDGHKTLLYDRGYFMQLRTAPEVHHCAAGCMASTAACDASGVPITYRHHGHRVHVAGAAAADAGVRKADAGRGQVRYMQYSAHLERRGRLAALPIRQRFLTRHGSFIRLNIRSRHQASGPTLDRS